MRNENWFPVSIKSLIYTEMKLLRFFEFKEHPKNTDTLYEDDNVSVKVVKTYKASKNIGKNTAWCSNSRQGFTMHNTTLICIDLFSKMGIN